MMRFVCSVCFLWAAVVVGGAETKNDVPTAMTTRGKLVLSEDLGTEFGKEWKVAKGKWTPTDGAMKGVELKDDMHGAVARRNVNMPNAIVQLDFKLDGAKVVSLSVNGPKGHVCRVRINSSSFAVVKDDQDGKNGPDKAAVLATCETPLKAGVWHTLVLEVHGGEMLARIGDKFAYGKHEAVAASKTNVGLTVSGESASFRNLRIWEADADKNWEMNRAKYAK